MGGTRVYIGGLPYGVREKDLERFFKGYGRIRDILIKNGYGFVEFDDYRDADDAVYELNGKDLLGERVSVQMAHASRGSRGGGGGGFRDRRGGFRDNDRRGRGGDDGKAVIVERARGVPREGRGGMGGGGGGRQMNRNSRGTPRSSDKYGPPTRTEYRLVVENLSSRVSWQDLKDYMRQAGEVTYADAHKQRRNEGVVEFASYSDLKAAVEKLDDTELNGRRIRLVEDRGRGRGKRSRSSSRSRSRSKSLSRSRGRRESRSKSKSKSRSKSRSKSKTRSKSRDSREKSKSRSPDKAKKEKISRSRSHSRSRSKSRDKSRSRSRSESKSRSRSKSIEKNGERSGDERGGKEEDGDD